ncbi:Hypothetical predicted protein, partial [Marmota monax]
TSESWPATRAQRSNPAATTRPALQAAPSGQGQREGSLPGPADGPRHPGSPGGPARSVIGHPARPALSHEAAAYLVLQAAPGGRRREGSRPGLANGLRPPGSANGPAHPANGPPALPALLAALPPASAGPALQAAPGPAQREGSPPGPADGLCPPGSANGPAPTANGPAHQANGSPPETT